MYINQNIVISDDSKITPNQKRHLCGLLDQLNKNNIVHENIDNVIDFLNGRTTTVKEISEQISLLTKVKNLCINNGLLKPVTNKEYPIISDNQDKTNTLSDIYVLIDENVVDSAYGKSSILFKFELDLKDIPADQISLFDDKKKYYTYMSIPICNVDINGEGKAGAIYKMQNQTKIDERIKTKIEVIYDDILKVGINLKYKQWKKVVSEDGETIWFSDREQTTRGKFFEYHGEFWHTLNNVNNKSLEVITQRDEAAEKALINKLANSNSLWKWLKLTKLTNEEIVKKREKNWVFSNQYPPKDQVIPEQIQATNETWNIPRDPNGYKVSEVIDEMLWEDAWNTSQKNNEINDSSDLNEDDVLWD